MKILAHIETKCLNENQLSVTTRYVSPRVRKLLPFKAGNVTICSDEKTRSLVADTPRGLVLNLEGAQFLSHNTRKPAICLVPDTRQAAKDIKLALRELRML